MKLLIALVLACAAIASAQIPLTDVQTLGGPWEFTSPSGIDGVFISFNSFLNDKSGQITIASQGINLLVYHRQRGVEHKGYFSPGESPSASVSIDAQHLTMRFTGHTEVGPFEIDLRYDPASHRWSGTWKSVSKSRDVTLERPHMATSAPSPFVGDWVGQTSGFARTSLHIRQSSDGQFVAWLDRGLSTFNPRTNLHDTDQRNGELLVVVSTDSTNLQLKAANGFGNTYLYNGVLSDGGRVLSGSWPSAAGGSGRLNAPGTFTRSE